VPAVVNSVNGGVNGVIPSEAAKVLQQARFQQQQQQRQNPALAYMPGAVTGQFLFYFIFTASLFFFAMIHLRIFPCIRHFFFESCDNSFDLWGMDDENFAIFFSRASELLKKYLLLMFFHFQEFL
jgi:hypothetical protein